MNLKIKCVARFASEWISSHCVDFILNLKINCVARFASEWISSHFAGTKVSLDFYMLAWGDEVKVFLQRTQ